VLSNNEAERTI